MTFQLRWKSECTSLQVHYMNSVLLIVFSCLYQRFCSAVDHDPNCSASHFLKGVSLWKSEVTDKRAAYSSFIKVTSDMYVCACL